MKKQKLKVEIEVWDINVAETYTHKDGNGAGFYGFNYSVKINGGKKKIGELDGSWSSQTRKQFRAVLGRGYASRLVLEKLF